jgi:hypothetical protein
MKHLMKIAGLFVISLTIFSCSNQDWEFEDFEYTTTYFPIQFPVRTLVYGDYNYEGENDSEFLISATKGGGYTNKKDVTVGFTIDNSLVDNLYAGNTKIQVMPPSWYTLSSPNQIFIPKGELSGGVSVTLNDAFFADPASIGACWAIPLRMTSTTAASMLVGFTLLDNADPRIVGNWTKAPKDFTIFCVKYVNEWHGRYLLRGTSVCKNSADGSVVETVRYAQRYLEQNQVVSFSTAARYQSRYSAGIRHSDSGGASYGNFDFLMDYNNSDNTGTIKKHPNFKYDVTGTAKMVKGAESWGDEDRNVIYLDYKIDAGERYIEVKDTLVFRDKNVKFEEFSPAVRN